jgi:hypothetical protein
MHELELVSNLDRFQVDSVRLSRSIRRRRCLPARRRPTVNTTNLEETAMSIINRLGLAAFYVCLAAVNVAGEEPQATQKKEAVPKSATATTTQLRGEVVAVGPNWLVAKMVPEGDYRYFDVRPGAVATIEGVKKSLSQLRLGTMLTAAVTTKETQLVNRTTTITKGRLLWSTPKTIFVSLENGENRQYAVPPGFKFTVEGKQLGVEELRAGMILTGTNVTEEPVTLITEETVVYGTEPKR